METQISETQIKLINIFNDRFQKLEDPAARKNIVSTADMFFKFKSLWPSEEYTMLDVYQVLNYLEVDGVNGAGDKFFWLLQEKI